MEENKKKKVIQISLQHLILIVLVIAIIIGGVLFAHMQKKSTTNSKTEVNQSATDIKEEQTVKLEKTHTAIGLQLSIGYSSDWEIEEESSSYLKFMNQKDEDAFIGVFIEKDFDNTREVKDYLYAYNDMTFTTQEEGKITIAALEGYYHKVYVEFDGNRVYEAGIVKDGNLYKFMYYTNKTDYAKYEEVFEKMLKTVKFIQVEFSNEEVQETFYNYVSFISGTMGGARLEVLYDLGIIDNCDYNKYDEVIINDGVYFNTNIPYDTFKKAMLNYISEFWFEGLFSEDGVFEYTYKNKDGILYFLNPKQSGSGILANLYRITKLSSNSYRATLKAIGGEYESDFNFSVGKYNGKCVITYCDELE